jgi:sarcosine oxidase subunit beta
MGIGPKEEPSHNFHSSWQFLEQNCAIICEALPILRKLNVVRQWAGQYDMSPDRHPVIDEADTCKNFYSVCGFSGHGFMVAPRIAILMANYLTGQKDSIDITKFSKKRFATGDILVEPSVV